MRIGLLSGEGIHLWSELEHREEYLVTTPFARIKYISGSYHGHQLFYVLRHADRHEGLASRITYRANMAAFDELRVDMLVSTGVTALLDASLPLHVPLIFNDLFFPENRLPNGDLCTLFGRIGYRTRGHYVFDYPFSQKLNAIAKEAFDARGVHYEDQLVVAHSNGPRFQTRAEARWYRAAGCHALSQTLCPEVILAGELELPVILIGTGIGYANGVGEHDAEPLSRLDCRETLTSAVKTLIEAIPASGFSREDLFKGCVFRFEDH